MKRRLPVALHNSHFVPLTASVLVIGAITFVFLT